MRRHTIIAALLPLLAAALWGCWPFHRGPTPQQQLIEALSRGNSVGANQLWNSMSGEERARFQRGEGMSPQISPDQVKAQIRRHQMESPGSEATVNIPQIDRAGLMDLPSIAPAAAPPPEPSPGSE